MSRSPARTAHGTAATRRSAWLAAEHLGARGSGPGAEPGPTTGHAPRGSCGVRHCEIPERFPDVQSDPTSRGRAAARAVPLIPACLLDDGQIPSQRLPGSRHRKILLAHVLAFAEPIDSTADVESPTVAAADLPYRPRRERDASHASSSLLQTDGLSRRSARVLHVRPRTPSCLRLPRGPAPSPAAQVRCGTRPSVTAR